MGLEITAGLPRSSEMHSPVRVLKVLTRRSIDNEKHFCKTFGIHHFAERISYIGGHGSEL